MPMGDDDHPSSSSTRSPQYLCHMRIRSPSWTGLQHQTDDGTREPALSDKSRLLKIIDKLKQKTQHIQLVHRRPRSTDLTHQCLALERKLLILSK